MPDTLLKEQSMDAQQSQLHPVFASSYRRLGEACARAGATLETPSSDGYVRRIRRGDRSVTFTADALPFNSAAAHALARDKIATAQLLDAAGLPIPRWLPFFGEQTTESFTKQINKQFPSFPARLRLDEVHAGGLVSQFPSLIVKPSTASNGRGVVRCTTIDEVCIAAKRALAYSHAGIVQEYIEGIDYRGIFLDNEILLTTREENNRPVIASDAPTAQIAQAQKLLGLRYGSIDLRKKDDGTFVILELNGNPGFDRLERYYQDEVPHVMDDVVAAILSVMQ